MHIDDPCLELRHDPSQNYFIACYAVSLTQGNTISGTTVRSNTVKNYINDYIDIFVRTLHNYKSMPERRNMITNKMTMWMTTHVATLPHTHPAVAIFDWIVLGRYAGFRASEWCQTSQHTYKHIAAWPGQTPKAFIRDHFEFFQDGEIPVPDITTQPISSITSIWIRWRTQKNKQNGEKIPFFRDTVNLQLCPVAAAARIVWHAHSLHSDPNIPLGVRPTKATSLPFKYITLAATTTFLRQAAQEAHKLPPKHPNIAAWSTHSIRVTAANLLHCAKFSNSFIQNRLRWRSNTFLMYLCNMFYSAQSHTTALALDLCGIVPPSGDSP